MSIIFSLLNGNQGNYNILGAKVTFGPFAYGTMPSGGGMLRSLMFGCLSSHFFRVISNSYTHVFMHEMGHAVATKLLTNQNPKVTIFNDCFGGITHDCSSSGWKDVAIDAAGPLGSMVFSSCKLAIAVLLYKQMSKPVGYLLGAQAAISMFGELLYAASYSKGGDFGNIADYGLSPLLISLATLVSTCALGVLGSIKLYRL